MLLSHEIKEEPGGSAPLLFLAHQGLCRMSHASATCDGTLRGVLPLSLRAIFMGVPGVPSGLSRPSLEETYSSSTADPAYWDLDKRFIN